MAWGLRLHRAQDGLLRGSIGVKVLGSTTQTELRVRKVCNRDTETGVDGNKALASKQVSTLTLQELKSSQTKLSGHEKH